MRDRRALVVVSLLALAAAGVLVWRLLAGGNGGEAPAAGPTASPPPLLGADEPAAGSGRAGFARATAAPAALPEIALAGVVRDAVTGDPLARADVLALPEPGGAMPEVGAVAPGPGGVSATSDGEGRYALARLAPGWYRLRASADGYHLPPDREPAVLVRDPAAAPPATADLFLVPLAQLSGQVIDRAGAPLGAVEVRCAAGDEAPEDAPPGLGRDATGADGRFDVLCFSGEVVLHARKEGYANGRSERVRVAPAGHLGGIVIVLDAGHAEAWPLPAAEEEPPSPARLAGRVVDAAGAPVAAFRVHVARIAGARGKERPPAVRSVLAPDGRFEIGGLWPGRYNALVSAASALAPARAPAVELHPGLTTDVGELALLVAGGVEGRVTEAATGRPIAGVAVSVSGSLGDLAPYLGEDVFTREDGGYELAGILPGRRSIEFTHPGYDHVLRTGSVVGAGEALRLDVTMTPRTKKGSGAIAYAGIGAVLAMRESRLIVEKVFDGGPARAAGLLPGDVVVSIDGQAAAELGFTDAIEALRGVAGTTVRLELSRAGTRFLLDVVRAQLAVPPPPDEE